MASGIAGWMCSLEGTHHATSRSKPVQEKRPKRSPVLRTLPAQQATASVGTPPPHGGSAMQRTRAIASVLAFALSGPVGAIDDGADDTIFANGFEDYVLTIDNYLVWCTISVDGAAATPNPPP